MRKINLLVSRQKEFEIEAIRNTAIVVEEPLVKNIL